MSVPLDPEPLHRELEIERRLADFLAEHDAPVSDREQAELRERIRRDIAGGTRG